ncbi:MAG: DciA family protein [Planctomycetota bacterium]
MAPRGPLRQLEQLRERRARPERDLSIRSMVQATADALRRTERGLGELIEHWQAVVPPDLAARSSLAALRGGVLEVRVDSASVRYELDRVLRSGGLRELQRRYRGTLVRVRLRLGTGRV